MKKELKSQVKQVIVIRKDLQMRKGKMCSQSAHASMGKMSLIFRSLMRFNPIPLMKFLAFKPNRIWLKGSFTKIVVYVKSEQELIDLHNDAIANGVQSYLIEDNGATEFNGVKTKTAIAVGPDYSKRVDIVTNGLPLL